LLFRAINRLRYAILPDAHSIQLATAGNYSIAFAKDASAENGTIKAVGHGAGC
jgi:hypothetical protein